VRPASCDKTWHKAVDGFWRRGVPAKLRQLGYWTDTWLERIRALYRARNELAAAWQAAAAPAPQQEETVAARLENAYAGWDDAITVIDQARKKQMAGLNLLTYLTAYLDECGRHGGKPLTGPALERFLPWNASPEDLRTWAQPPPSG
jgi:hypothetical protein